MKFLLSFLGLMVGLHLCTAQVGTKVLLKTDKGDILLGLYDSTALHKNNFEKLVKEGFYDGVLFHRVISDFMIQTGDPESKTAEADAKLGNGGPGYQIPAEIRPEFIHKKGALAAARQGDQVNPERKSSGSQFYIVQGKTYTSEELAQTEQSKAQGIKQQILQNLLAAPENEELRKRLEGLSKVGNQRELNFMLQQMAPTIKAEYQKQYPGYTEEQIETYATLGGTPFLDGAYTVFGEVLEGLDIVDSIASVKTNAQNRPNEDLRIIKAKIVK